MKKFLLILAIVISAIGVFAIVTLYHGGYFRKVETRFDGEILQELPIFGAEDIAISREDSFLIISADDRVAYRNSRMQIHGLYFVDLKVRPFEVRFLPTPIDDLFFPHGISLLKIDSARYKIWAVNHVRKTHPVEVFEFNRDSLVHLETISDELLVSPNDLVALDEKRFYLTNDHRYRYGWRSTAEDFLGLPLSNVLYFDGERFSEAAGTISYANGINFDPRRNLLFVASPRSFTVKVYKAEGQNLEFVESIDAGTGVDNIEFDPEGNLWIGSHPNLMLFSNYASGKVEKAPSEIVKIVYREKGDYEVNSIFLDDGSVVSASTVAIPFQDVVFIGNFIDSRVVVWQRNPATQVE